MYTKMDNFLLFPFSPFAPFILQKSLGVSAESIHLDNASRSLKKVLILSLLFSLQLPDTLKHTHTHTMTAPFPIISLKLKLISLDLVASLL